MRDPISPLVVLDGHAIIHMPFVIETIDPSVFRSIGVGGIIHLSAAPELIYRNRTGDTKRSRPHLSLIEIADQQRLSLEATMAVVKTLKIPLLIISASEDQIALSFMGGAASS